MKRWGIILVLVLGFFLRVLWLDKYPIGFTADEASFGYDAYSILKTGKDQWGEILPLTLRSFGDFKPSLYAYLTIPSVYILGLSEFSVRIPSAIIGTLAVFATYLLVMELFKDNKLAIFSGLLLAISPWHLSLSRGAFESNLTSFFLSLGIWGFLKGIKNPNFFFLSTVSFGLNLFSYHTARFITPILVFGLYFWKRQEIKKLLLGKHSKKSFYLSATIFFLFLILAYSQFFTIGSIRVSDIGIFNPTDKWVSVVERRYEAIINGLPDLFARIFSNKLVFFLRSFVNNYISYFSPQFLFTYGPSERTYGMIPGRGVLYLFELPFILTGLWVVIKKGIRKATPLFFLLLWILISPLPASLVKGPAFAANRVAFMIPALEIFSAYGGLKLISLISNRLQKRVIIYFNLIIFIIIFLSLTFFLEDYIYHAPAMGAAEMLYGRKEATLFVSSIENSYTKIIFSRSLTESHIWVAFYKKWEPFDYQQETQSWIRYEKEGYVFLDLLNNYSLGKYSFGDINFDIEKKKKDILFVGKPEDFASPVVPLKTIYYPNHEPAIIIVDPDKT